MLLWNSKVGKGRAQGDWTLRLIKNPFRLFSYFSSSSTQFRYFDILGHGNIGLKATSNPSDDKSLPSATKEICLKATMTFYINKTCLKTTLTLMGQGDTGLKATRKP